MRKAERGFGSGRVASALLVGSLAIALAGCGGSDGSSSAGVTSSTGTAIADSVASSGSSGTGTSGTTSGTSGSGTTTTPPASTAATSAVTLGWVPPTQNSDGSVITDLAGYKIHYGTASASYTQVVSVDNAGLTRYVLDNLASGTYYFAITAYNSKGLESALSEEVKATVN
jgi:hypothetical protein